MFSASLRAPDGQYLFLQAVLSDRELRSSGLTSNVVEDYGNHHPLSAGLCLVDQPNPEETEWLGDVPEAVGCLFTAVAGWPSAGH